MTLSIHGHDVLDLLMAPGAEYTLDSLRQALRDSYGADARFHTCSAEGWTADQLLEFFQARGKIRIVDGIVHPNRAEICGN